ncbi:glycerol-3-phosphate acyltransferase [Leptothermofonsia sichuanensis E412]|uniref:glycerol-3-phosphate 1-O-acyltransferase PlsY n=1 Tax=Leptothermofonsia sichuanensis TaxID=2917832 RepID=UPI001CA73A29|nr:glycerol-3-phosphate 1-O-acyltransferase PlsY [Leptothermofonsia sichuanensis]QZZ22067.1 glycerol-3-phosphate acyltransferase [Leptothermofonsia sichuanensis E412]
MALWYSLNGLLLLLAYLLGSIPTGYWAGKLLQGIDIREHGSRSTGATNVLRTLGKGPAAIVLLVDILKGAAAIALVQAFYASAAIQPFVPPTLNPTLWAPWMVTLAGILVLLGHSKSIFLNFTGGKSVATSLGVLLTMNWMVGIGTLSVFLVVLAISRIVSLSSIAGAIAVCGLMVLFVQPVPYLLFAVVGGFYVILRHRANIQRLLSGTEPRLGEKMPETSPPSS